MNWLEFNHVHIHCFDKLVLFPEFEEGEYMMFMSTKKMDESLKDDTQVFMMLALLKDERKVVIGDLPLVCDFSEVFPDDISDFPPECEVEFAIELVPGTSPVSIHLIECML